MPVAVECVAVDHRVAVAVSGEEALEVVGGVGEAVDGHGDILDEACGADLPCAADCGENPAAHGPVSGDCPRIGGERRRGGKRKRPERIHDAGAMRLKLVLPVGLDLHEERASRLGEAGQLGEVPLHHAHGLAVEELRRRRRACRLDAHDRLARGTGGREEEQRGFGKRCDRSGAEGDLGEEGEGAFTAGDEVRDDVEGVVEFHERQDGQPRDVLDGVLSAYAGGKFRVGPGSVAQLFDAFQEGWVRVGERGAGFRAARIESCAVSEDDAHGFQHPVAVCVGAAAHAGCVVHHDPADHCAVDRCRVRREAPPIRAEYLVHPAADHARHQADPLAAVEHLVALPALAAHHEERVGDGLPGKRGSGGAERYRPAFAPGARENLAHFAFVRRHEHFGGDHSVEAGVCAPGQPFDVSFQRCHGGLHSKS